MRHVKILALSCCLCCLALCRTAQAQSDSETDTDSVADTFTDTLALEAYLDSVHFLYREYRDREYLDTLAHALDHLTEIPFSKAKRNLVKNALASYSGLGLAPEIVPLLMPVATRAKKLGEEGEHVFVLSHMASTLRDNALHTEALQWGDSLKHYATLYGNIHMLINGHNLVSGVAFELGSFVLCLREGKQALALGRQAQDTLGIIDAHGQLGNAFSFLEVFDSAIYHYGAQLDLAEVRGDRFGKIIGSNNLGLVYKKKGDYTAAAKLLTDGLKMAENPFHEMAFSLNLGQVYRLMDSLGRSEELLMRAGEHIARGSANSKTEWHIQVAHTYLGQGRVAEAQYHAEQGQALALQHGQGEKLRLAYQVLSDVYGRQGRYRQAWEAERLEQQYADSLKGTRVHRQVGQLQAQFAAEQERERLMMDQERDRMKASLQLRRQQGLSLAGGVGVLALAVLAFMVLRRNREKQQHNEELVHRNEEIAQLAEEIRAQRDQMEGKNQSIAASLNYAKRIQQSLLPGEPVLQEAFADYFLFYEPRDVVSGDFYWFHATDEGWYWAVADGTGHGVPGAIMSVIGINLLNEVITQYHNASPAEVLESVDMRLRWLITQDGKSMTVRDGMDIGLVHYAPRTNTLTFAGAKHSLLVAANDEVTRYAGARRSVSADDPAPVVFEDITIPWQQGMALYMYSDGLTDQFGGAKGKKWMPGAFRDFVNHHHHLPMPQQGEQLKEAFYQWKGQYMKIDDVVAMGVRL